MKISTKGRYGLRAMVDLAINAQNEHVALSAVAERQNISTNYLEQVFSGLRKAGLVKSVKGAQGGYTLTENPENIKVGTILRVLEGSLSVIDGLDTENIDSKSIQYCLKQSVWDKIDESISTVVDSITLEDLVNDYKRLNSSDAIMYYI
ncbi:MAG: Rrf2 family transcriptional regulator [Clostridiaceae bacterium]|jgi:Rrf2 family cysteine metabolism transcriptional repressor|nr:Rrf2 family transcriptional regulator [Clostridiaceae bacterium]